MKTETLFTFSLGYIRFSTISNVYTTTVSTRTYKEFVIYRKSFNIAFDNTGVILNTVFTNTIFFTKFRQISSLLPLSVAAACFYTSLCLFETSTMFSKYTLSWFRSKSEKFILIFAVTTRFSILFPKLVGIFPTYGTMKIS